MGEWHSEVFALAQKTQVLADVWLTRDPMSVTCGLCRVMRDVPHCADVEDRVVVSLIIRRVAEAFVQAKLSPELTVEARLRRVHVSDIHAGRALQLICRDFATATLSLQDVANNCRISTAYLSHLLSVNTGHRFRTHLYAVRLFHAASLLTTSALSIEEVADRCGWRSKSALDREFKSRFRMTPREFRLWAT